jgi:uncharacterized repeat protein (TIGR01451 family)
MGSRPRFFGPAGVASSQPTPCTERRGRRCLPTAVLATLVLLLGAGQAAQAQIVVTRTDDVVPPVCNSGVDCSLRGAVLQANANAGADTITFAALSGTYTLTIAGADDTADAGDLDITGDLTIQGTGASQTIIQAGPALGDRVFDVGPTSAVTVTFEGITIQGGNAVNGGGIYSSNPSDITVTNSIITNNIASVAGAGISAENDTRLTLANTTVSDNTATVNGGGINCSPCNLSITGSTVFGNVATTPLTAVGGGISLQGSSAQVSIENSALTDNHAELRGGGIEIDGSSSAANSITSTTITGNESGFPTTSADFESGAQGFTAGNVINTLTWQRTTNRGSDAGHTPTSSFYFGNPTTFNYETGAIEGATLDSPPILVGAAPQALTFNYFLATEGGAGNWDIASVLISNDGGTNWSTLLNNRLVGGLQDNTGVWRTASANISSFAGDTVIIRFSFDTIDSIANNHEGWYVDDVAITSGEGAGISYVNNTQPLTVSLSRISGNIAGGVFQIGTGAVMAENNWWGCDDFPGAAGCDSVAGTVDADPRIDLRLTANPTAVALNRTSTLTADLTRNSDGAALPSLPVALEGLNIIFAPGAFGNVAASTVPIASGMAVTTFAGTLVGASLASARLDNGTETATVNVVAPPEITITDSTLAEGNPPTGSVHTFTVTRSHTLTNVPVSYATAPGTATSGADFTAASGTINFTIGGPSTVDIDVTVIGDLIVESDETFTVNLTADPLDATVVDSVGVGTIVNDDSATLTVGDTAVSEGNTGDFPTATFTVTLGAAVQGGLSISYATQDNSAHAADSDYNAVTGTLNFAGTANEEQSFSVTVVGDDKVELDETFFVNLAQTTGLPVSIPDPQGQGTITNDDQARLSISDVQQAELNSGSSQFRFTVILDTQVDNAVTVDFQTQDSTATAADSDYATASGSVTFPAASPAGTTQNVDVTVNGDTKVEANENFSVVLNNIQAGGRLLSFAKQVGIGTITNDDTTTLSINDVALLENAGGATTAFTFTVTLAHAVQGGLTIDFETANGTALVSDGDYVPRTTTTLPFAGAEAETQSITVTVNDDAKVEADETFYVNLTNIQAGGLPVSFYDSQGLGTILNDDEATVSIDDPPAVAEGASGTTKSYRFTVTLSAQVDTSVAVSHATADGSAMASDSDYVASANTVTFPAGSPAGATQYIDVTVVGDDKVEMDEYFYVNLSNIQAAGRNVTFFDPQGRGTILNDDRAQVVISDVLRAEGTNGATNFDFNAQLLDAVDFPVTVSYTTQDGTALFGDNDYTPATGSVTFSGVKNETKKITILVTGDSKVEPNEFFFVRLSNIQAGGRWVEFGDDVGQGDIVDDDQAALSISDVSKNEGAGGSSTTYTFVVSLSSSLQLPSGGSVSVSYSTANGTATTADNDYVSTGGTLSFNGTAGETRTLDVIVNNDNFAEPDETFFVDLSNVQAGGFDVVLGKSQGQGTIVNDDSMDLEITKDDQGVAVGPKDKIVYDLAYRNLGSATARQVRLIEVVPANTTFDSTSSAAGFSCSPDANAGSTCTLNVGTLSSGASGSGAFGVIVNDPLPGGVTETSNTARITDESADAADLNLANNSDSVSTTLKAAGADFYTLTPCRVIDTRNPVGSLGLGGPALVGTSVRVFQMGGTCGIPGDAVAIAANVTVTRSTAQGDLRIYPFGQSIPPTSVINYREFQTRANNAIIPTNAAQISVFAAQPSGSTVQFILDVTGYFR